MKEEYLISIAFPEDTYQKILQDVEEVVSQEMSETSIIIRKFIEFYLYFSNRWVCVDDEVYVFSRELFTCDVKLIKPDDLINLIFNDGNIDSILYFLNKYDNAYFWDAFGISLEKGNAFFEKMNSYSENLDVLTEIHTEIINSGKLKKDIIVDDLLCSIFFNHELSDDSCEFLSYLFYILNEVASKYPSIKEALSLIDDEDGWPIIDIRSVNQIYNSWLKDDEIPPKILFELIKIADASATISRITYILQKNLIFGGNVVKRVLFNSFRTHRYGYEAYQVYLSGCKAWKWEPAFEIGNNPERYFYNSYKVPQIKSLYNRYFSTLLETEAKDKTRTCFKSLYKDLITSGFLDPESRQEEFLWAFSLIDEYPYAFKKIKFYTISGRSKKEKGNGSFLALLYVLGYTKEEIKNMLHRDVDKTLINKVFDLSIQDKTIVSQDKNILLDIVKKSGLPIINK